MKYYPSLEELLDEDGDMLLELKPSPRSMLGILTWAVLSFFIIIIVWWYSGSSQILFFLGITLFLGIEAVRRYNDDLYILEEEKITHKGGRLSMSYSMPSIRYADIRSTSVNQSFTGRIFDYGSLELNTAAQDQGEVFITGVRAPDELGMLIEDLRRYRYAQDTKTDE